MNRKYLGIIIIAAGLLLLAGIVYIIFFHKFAPPAAETPPISEEKATAAPAKPQPTATVPPTPVVSIEPTAPAKKEMTTEDLGRLAALFAERFGSFSNHSNYGNIDDLRIFMSDKMKVWADNYITEAIARGGETNIYYGITTKAIIETVKQFDETGGRAEVLVKTRRREAAGATSNASYFEQDILISFVKERGAWKVNSAYWQAK